MEIRTEKGTFRMHILFLFRDHFKFWLYQSSGFKELSKNFAISSLEHQPQPYVLDWIGVVPLIFPILTTHWTTFTLIADLLSATYVQLLRKDDRELFVRKNSL